VDVSGNTSENTLDIGVGVVHDQRAHDCPAVADGEFLSECVFGVQDGGPDGGVEPRRFGCSMGDAGGAALAVLAVLGLLAVAFRRRR
jgi:MYXO-CTERM domain-containing protein